MNEINTLQLVELQDGEVTTTSLKVANLFGKQHKIVLRDIRNLMNRIDDIGVGTDLYLPNNLFHASSYSDVQGKNQPMFTLTKDGFTLLVMGYTDRSSMKFKLQYISQFNAMEKYIREQEQNQFFLPETPDQQLKREKLAISQQRANTAQSREIRAWINMVDDKEEVIKQAAPKVLSELLDIPETRLLGEV